MTFCCCRGRVPSYGAATMWRIETLSGIPDRVYDRGANSLCCQVVQEGSDRVIYEGGTRTSGGKSVTAWVDDPSGPRVLWAYDPGATLSTVYDICRQADDESLWVFRTNSGLTSDIVIERLNYATGALLNSTTLTVTGTATTGYLAAGDNARVSFWSQASYVPEQFGANGFNRALQFDDSLANVASITTAPQRSVHRGAVGIRDARSGWVRPYLTSAAHDNELLDTDLASSAFVDDAAATGSSSVAAMRSNSTHFVRYTQAGATHRWERWSTSARVWGITAVSGDSTLDNCLDSDGNFYFSHPTRNIKRYSAAAGAVDWTYSYGANSLQTLFNDRDLILAFATETTGVNIVALNRSTGAAAWSLTQSGFVPTQTYPHFGRHQSAAQVWAQHTYVCGNRRT